MVRYRHLPCDLYGDTVYVNAKKYTSLCGNICALIFATDFGWSQVYGMATKSDAHDTLSLLFQRNGVPNQLIVDSAKELRKEESGQKCREAFCYLKGTEPYSPWQNAAERENKELKKDAGRKMTDSSAPLKVWDWALEMEYFIRSHTAHNIYKLDGRGRVPESIISGQTADFSPYCEYGFWQWVMFRKPGDSA